MRMLPINWKVCKVNWFSYCHAHISGFHMRKSRKNVRREYSWSLSNGGVTTVLGFSKMSRPSRERINLVASPWRNSLISNNFTTFPAFVSKSIQRLVCALMTGPAFIMANFNLGSATYTHYYKTCTSHPPPWLQNFMTLTLCASEGKPKKYQPHGCCKKCCLPVTTIPHTG